MVQHSYGTVLNYKIVTDADSPFSIFEREDEMHSRSFWKWIVLTLVALPSVGQVMTAKPVFAGGVCQTYELNKVYVSDTISEFDFSETRAQGHIDFTESGLHMYTESNTSLDKVAGYTFVVSGTLLSAVHTFEQTYVPVSGGIPGGQIRVDINNDGLFTNADATLINEDVYQIDGGDDEWWSNYDFGVGGGNGYNTFASLATISAAHPTLKVLSTGFSLGSGVLGEGTLQSIQFNCTVFVFDPTPPPQLMECDSYETVRVTPINNQGIDLVTESRTKGHYQYESDGLRIWTDDNSSQAKIAGYLPVSYTLPSLADFVLDYTIITGTVPPGGQAVIDKDSDGDVDGILVYEPGYYPAGVWWSNQNFGVESGGGYTTYATLNRILEVNPDAVVRAVGFSLGSGIYGGGVIDTLTAGCTIYEFGLEQVTVLEPTVNTIDQCNEYGSITTHEVEGVEQTVTPPGATEGEVTWSATAEAGYELVGYTGPKTYDLGTYYTCPAQYIAPIVIEIQQCGMPGGVYTFSSPGVNIFENPDGAIEGSVTVTATAQSGYHLVGYPGSQTYDLGTYEACPPTVVTNTVVVTNTEVVTDVVVVTNTETVTDVIVVTNTVNVTNTEVVTNVLVVTNTVNVTHTEFVTDVVVITNTVIVTNTELVTDTIIVTDTLVVTDTIVVTETEFITSTELITDVVVITETVTVTREVTYVEPGWPVFVEPTCQLPVSQVYLPGSDSVAYITEGDNEPGGTVRVRAVLRQGVDAELRGQSEFTHTFKTRESLNCEISFSRTMFFPKLEKQ